jgi:hypothetical protein
MPTDPDARRTVNYGVIQSGGVQNIGNQAIGPGARAISGAAAQDPARRSDITGLLAEFERLLAEHRSALPESDAAAKELRRLKDELDEDKPEPSVVQRALDRITAFVRPVTPLAAAAAQLIQAIHGTTGH